MEYAEFAPAPALAGIVRCFWTLRGEAPSADDRPADPAFPDGSPELILNLGDAFEHRPPRGRAVRQPAAFLVGQITRPMYVRPTGRIDLVAARFEAHGAAMLHRPMRSLNDRWIAVEKLAGRPLQGAIGEVRATASTKERIARLTAALESCVARGPAADPRVAECVQRIRSSRGAVPMTALASDVGLSARSLQRLFAREVGIAPKLLARIVRLQHVFAAVREEPASFSRVALECGYYDQPHLIRDFREFAGDAPAQLLASTPEFTAFFTALATRERA
jgi:AraC-like DNA-binding protein